MRTSARVALAAVALTAGAAVLVGGLDLARGGDPKPGTRRVVLDRIGRAPGLDGAGFDPVTLVRAVNDLQPHGKEVALDALRAFLDHARAKHLDDQGVFLILRALFDLPPGRAAFPPMLVGAPDWAPADPAALPRFPLGIERDLPLFLVHGYSLGGTAEDPRVHLEWCARNGVIRAAPLRPPDDPWTAADALVARTPALAGPGHEHARALVRMQVLRAVSHVRPGRGDADERALYDAKGDAAWAVMEGDLAARRMVWSTTRLRYERR